MILIIIVRPMSAEGPVIVTGTSTGIGSATTQRLLDAGREVISLDIKAAPLSLINISEPTRQEAIS